MWLYCVFIVNNITLVDITINYPYISFLIVM